jgi:NADH-quinone oxidoreductase subunit F
VGLHPADNTKPVYLICNADESEPGTFKDRYIMHQDPHQLIEGMTIACFAVNAKLAYIYIREEFPEAAKILEKAIAEAHAKGFPRQEHPRQRLRLRDLRAPRCRCLHLR